MFQYAFYLYLKKDNNDVYFDTSDFKVHNHHQGFELDRLFNVEYSIPTKKQLKSVSTNKNSFFYRAFRKALGLELIRNTTEYNCIINNSFVERCTYSDDLYFAGYWQNSKYVDEVEEQVRKAFFFPDVSDDKNKEIIKYIKENESVSLHVRCGDYINNASLGGICNQDYYSKAISVIKDKVDNCKFIVFSDDVEWVKNNLDLPSDSTYVDWNKGKDSYIDMQLMSYCKHNIIANSSFSWWGAWLNSNPNKTVVMPKKWFKKYSCNLLSYANSIQIKGDNL